MKLIRQNAAYRPFLWFLFFIATASLLDISISRFHSYSYLPDKRIVGDEGWKGRQSYFAPAFLGLVPLQVPGPLDMEPGEKEARSVGIEVPFHRESRVTVLFLDSHPTFPPVFRATIDGKIMKDFSVAPDAVSAPSGQGNSYRRVEVDIIIPEALTPGVLWLTPIKGSWAAIEGVNVASVPPIWEYALAILSIICLVALARKEKNVLQKIAGIFALAKGLSWKTAFLIGAGALLTSNVAIHDAKLSERLFENADDEISAFDREVANVITCAKPNVKIRFSPNGKTDRSINKSHFLTQYAFAPLTLDIGDWGRSDFNIAGNKKSSRFVRLSTGIVESQCEAQSK